MTDLIARTDTFIASLGLETWRVGGSVRDEIMGRKPKDGDYVVTEVSLAELYSILNAKKIAFKPLRDRNDRDLGVRLHKGGIEITLPRKEISTGPKHSDFDIVLDPHLGIGDDALRRDFTFNALYRWIAPDGTAGEVADPTGCGLYDLGHRLIRTTHTDSFRDDPLRILRALRFMSTLGYDLAMNTAQQMHMHADAVDGFKSEGYEETITHKRMDGPDTRSTRLVVPTTVSGTVFDEFCKMLMGEKPHVALRTAAETGVLGRVFPELSGMIDFDQGSRYHDLTTDEHTFKALETAAHVDAPLRVRWALLFHDSGKPETAWRGKDGRLHYYSKVMMRAPDGVIEFQTDDHEVVSERLWREAAMRMNVPRALREDVALLIREHMVACESKVKWAKVASRRIALGDDMLADLYLHRLCDLAGKGKANQAHMANIAAAEGLRQRMVEEKVPHTAKDLEINGRDARDLGMRGRWIGGALSVILFDVAVDPSPLKRSRDWQMKELERAAQHRAGIDSAIERSK